MEIVNFEKVKPGDLVRVPRYHFAPNRRGWNGWVFSDGIVIRKGFGKNFGKKLIAVEMCVPKNGNEYKTVNKTFLAENVFETNSIETAKKFLEEDGIVNKEEFYQFIANEDVTGCDWIKFLVDNGFLFQDE